MCKVEHHFEALNEALKEIGLSTTPWDMEAFRENDRCWNAASWEVRAQWYEWMAQATRMFAPVGGA